MSGEFAAPGACPAKAGMTQESNSPNARRRVIGSAPLAQKHCWRSSLCRGCFVQVALHHLDLLLLFDNDTLSKTPQNRIAAVDQFELGHVDRALVMRNHH